MKPFDSYWNPCLLFILKVLCSVFFMNHLFFLLRGHDVWLILLWSVDPHPHRLPLTTVISLASPISWATSLTKLPSSSPSSPESSWPYVCLTTCCFTHFFLSAWSSALATFMWILWRLPSSVFCFSRAAASFCNSLLKGFDNCWNNRQLYPLIQVYDPVIIWSTYCMTPCHICLTEASICRSHIVQSARHKTNKNINVTTSLTKYLGSKVHCLLKKI